MGYSQLRFDVVWELEHFSLPALVKLVVLCRRLSVLCLVVLAISVLGLVVVVDNYDQIALAPLLLPPLLAVGLVFRERLVPCGFLLVSSYELRVLVAVGDVVLLVLVTLVLVGLFQQSFRALQLPVPELVAT